MKIRSSYKMWAYIEHGWRRRLISEMSVEQNMQYGHFIRLVNLYTRGDAQLFHAVFDELKRQHYSISLGRIIRK